MSAVAPLALRLLTDLRDPRWDAYVLAHSEGTFFHLLGWRRVLERAYPHRPFYLYDEDESARLLKDGARALAEREKLEYVELKSEKRRFPDLTTKADLYVTFRQE